MTLEKFQEQFFPHVMHEIEPLTKLRSKAWDRFLEIALPKQGHEDFQYIQFAPFYESTFQKAAYSVADFQSEILPECQDSYLLFVDGHFRKELSNTSGLPSAIVIEPFSKAIRTYGTLLQNAFTKTIAQEKDPFVLLNCAVFTDAAFVYVPPKMAVEKPLQVIHLVTQEQSWIMPRLQLFQGAFSELTVVSTLIVRCEKALFNSVVDCALEENAKTTFIQTAMGNPAATQPTNWCFEAILAGGKRASSLQTMQISDGSLHLRRKAHLQLLGEGAEALLSGIALLNGTKEAHTHVVIEHAAPHTHSNQLFKSVLTDGAHSSFQGKILVQQIAQKTEAYQLNKNLLLSSTAQANSKPNLEIFADDVKASHGSTIGQLEKEELFYLRARGFTEEEAQKTLISGFCQEVVQKIPLASIRDMAIGHIEKYVQ